MLHTLTSSVNLVKLNAVILQLHLQLLSLRANQPRPFELYGLIKTECDRT